MPSGPEASSLFSPLMAALTSFEQPHKTPPAAPASICWRLCCTTSTNSSVVNSIFCHLPRDGRISILASPSCGHDYLDHCLQSISSFLSSATTSFFPCHSLISSSDRVLVSSMSSGFFCFFLDNGSIFLLFCFYRMCFLSPRRCFSIPSILLVNCTVPTLGLVVWTTISLPKP